MSKRKKVKNKKKKYWLLSMWAVYMLYQRDDQRICLKGEICNFVYDTLPAIRLLKLMNLWKDSLTLPRNLTRREQDIMFAHCLDKISDKSIAKKFKIVPSTVRGHRSRSIAKVDYFINYFLAHRRLYEIS